MSEMALLLNSDSSKYDNIRISERHFFLALAECCWWALGQISTLNLKVQGTLMSSKSWLEVWTTPKVPDWGLGSWWWWGWVNNVPNDLCSEFLLSSLYLQDKESSSPWNTSWRCGGLWRFLNGVLVVDYVGDASKRTPGLCGQEGSLYLFIQCRKLNFGA